MRRGKSPEESRRAIRHQALAWIYQRRHSGGREATIRNPVSWPLLWHPCFDSARLQGERPTFVTAKVGKAIAPAMTISPTSYRLDCAALFAPSGPAPTRTSTCSNMRALLPPGVAMLAVMQRREHRFDTAIRGPGL